MLFLLILKVLFKLTRVTKGDLLGGGVEFEVVVVGVDGAGVVRSGVDGCDGVWHHLERHDAVGNALLSLQLVVFEVNSQVVVQVHIFSVYQAQFIPVLVLNFAPLIQNLTRLYTCRNAACRAFHIF